MGLVWHARRSAARIIGRLAMASAVAGSLLATPLLARATESFTFVATIPLDGVVIQGCDEDVRLSGSLRDVFHVTENADGGATLLAVTAAAGLSGVGLTSGARYLGVGVTLQPSHWSNIPDGDLIEQLTSTFIDRTRLVGTAGARTFEIKTTFHITKVDTETVVIVDHFSVTCR